MIPSSSRHLWKSHVSSCSHTCASPCSEPFTERSQLGSSLLLIFLWPGLLESSRGKYKWLMWAYVFSHETQEGIYFHSNFLVVPPKADESVQFSSVAQSCPTLCDPMNRSTPGLPVHHKLPEFTQTHAHRVSDAIQPSHPLSSPSPPAPNPSQHQDLFQ